MKRKGLFSAVVFSCTLLAAGAGHAATYHFGEFISGTTKPTLGSSPFASLSVTSGAATTDPWVFRLSSHDLSGFGSSAFLGELAIGGEHSSVQVVEDSVVKDGGLSSVSYQSGGGPGGISTFQFRFDLTGPKQDHLTSGEWVQWAVTGLSSIEALGLHVQGWGEGAEDSAWYAPSPVPLPAAAWLMLSGLGSLLILARRRKGRTAAALAA